MHLFLNWLKNWNETISDRFHYLLSQKNLITLEREKIVDLQYVQEPLQINGFSSFWIIDLYTENFA